MSKRNDDFFVKKKPWSMVKDSLLACYLKPYFQKVLRTHRPITYIDGFAGAGKFLDGNDGSPLIALKIIQDCFAQTKVLDGHIYSYFVEAYHADLLTENIREYQNAQVISGKYEEKIQFLLNDCVGQNVFLYIDPYGVKELDFNFFASLVRKHFNSIELLLNLNSGGFLRMACAALGVEFKNEDDIKGLDEYDDGLTKSNVSLKETATIVAGGDYWESIVADYRNGKLSFYGAEERFVEEYCQRLNEHYLYVLNMPIKSKQFKNLPKYRMIYATNHPNGAVLMADNIFKREDLMREIQLGGQMSLFGNRPTVNVEKKLLDYLPRFKTFERFNVVLAKFFCTYGVMCSSRDITDVLKKFETQGKITVERNPSTTKTGKPSAFWDEKKGKIVKLKWNT